MPTNAEIIIGSDVNVKVGRRDCEEHKRVLGPFGLDDRNEKGKDLLQIYMANDMRVSNTFFDHSSHITYESFNKDQTKCMLDIFVTSADLHKRVRNCMVVDNGIKSDHSAVTLKLSITSIKFKESTKLQEPKRDWRRIQYEEQANIKFSDLILSETTEETPANEFCEIIMKAAAETATTTETSVDGWFEFSKDTLVPLIGHRNKMLHAIKHSNRSNNDLEHTKAQLKALQNRIDYNTAEAKHKWSAYYSDKVSKMNFDGKTAWEAIRLLTNGFSAHHKKTKSMAMRLPNGELAKNDEENMSVMGPHLNKVFNNHRPVDDTVLDLLEQREKFDDLDESIQWSEMIDAIKGLQNDKSPGEDGVPPNAFKAMRGEVLTYVFGFLTDFWEGDIDIEEWHRSRGVPVPKSGDLSYPNKWRFICLMSVMSELMSRIVNQRLFKIIDKHGNKFQFGSTPKVGCRDGIFTLKTLLILRRNHDLPSYVAFVDLVKAFDTANHELLIKILEKYGAHSKLCDAIRRLYTDLKVALKIGSSIEEILQTVGVRQGDNMAPVLFIFLMNAFAESLEAVWEKEGLGNILFHRASDLEFENGQLISHSRKKLDKGNIFRIIQSLYVDDGAFVLSSRNQLSIGSNLIFKHFARFGLEMHIGRVVDGKRKASKTEFVFFPQSQFLTNSIHHLLGDSSKINHDLSTQSNRRKRRHQRKDTQTNMQNVIECNGTHDAEMNTEESDETVEENLQQHIKREDNLYDESVETQEVEVADGFISFTKHFKYLGTFVSYSLRDDYDVDNRIKKANQSMGALKRFWNNRHVDYYSKYLIFMAIPINLLLFGCESWALRKALLRKMEVFVHRNVWKILKITIVQVMENRIRNEKIRTLFYDIPRAEVMIAMRQMSFLGHIVRSHVNHPPRLLLTAWCNNPRKRGRPLTCNKRILVQNLKFLYDGVDEVTIDDVGSLKQWYFDALDETYWNSLIKCLKSPNGKKPKRPNPAFNSNQPRRNPRRATRDRSNFNRSQPTTPPRRRQQQSTPSPPNHPPTPPPTPPSTPPHNNQQDYDPDGVGRNLYDSLKLFGLGFGATWAEVKQCYRSLSKIYHPDKHKCEDTGMTNEEALSFFQLINNAQEYLKEKL